MDYSIEIDNPVIPAPAGQYLVRADFDSSGYGEVLIPVIGWCVGLRRRIPVLAHDSELELTEGFEWYEGEGYVSGVALWDATSDVYSFGESQQFRGRGALESGLRQFYEMQIESGKSALIPAKVSLHT